MTRMAIIYKDMEKTARRYNTAQKMLTFVQGQIALDDDLCTNFMDEEERLLGKLDFLKDDLYGSKMHSHSQFTFHTDENGMMHIDTNGFDFVADYEANERPPKYEDTPTPIRQALDDFFKFCEEA